MKLRKILSALAASLMLMSAAACGGIAGGDEKRITIGYQNGLIYAPLVIAKQAGWIEEELPDYEVSWKRLDSGSALRDAHISNQIQAGGYGIGSFIVGWANGIDWRMVTSMNDVDMRVMSGNPEVTSMANLKSTGTKVAVPAPDSPQGIMVQLAAEQDTGDLRAYDAQMAVLGHPDALQALRSNQVAAHFATPPFSYVEEEMGAKEILSSEEFLGHPITGAGLVMMEDFVNDSPKVAEALKKRVNEAIKLIQDDPAKAAELLSAEDEQEVSAEEYEDYLSRDDITYTATPHGLKSFSDAMESVGIIEKSPSSWEDLVTEELSSLPGS